MLARYGGYVGVWVADPSGKSMAYAPYLDEAGQVNVGGNYSDRDYFKGVLATRDTSISRVILGRKSREPIIGVGVPISRADGA